MAVNSYTILIFLAVLILLSYFLNYLSKITKVPSVLWLIATGIVLNYSFDSIVREIKIYLPGFLELIGALGLIVIILEAAIDLSISRKKIVTIRNSLLLAIVILLLSSLGISLTLMMFLKEDFFHSIIYAIPLSVVSSAILIPSIHNLEPAKKEFMIYESAFSDIIGIMFFNFIVINEISGISNLQGILIIISTLVFSVFFSGILLWVFSKIQTKIKIFLLLSVLLLIYALGKEFHISSLLIVFVFGLMINNPSLIFRGFLAGAVNEPKLREINKDLQFITAETSFIIRTFFFVAFGMAIDIRLVFDPLVILIGSIIVIILYLIRYLNFKIVLKKNLFPEVLLSPRGLVTILLFYSIPIQYQIRDFSMGILFFVIITTGIIMSIALIVTPGVRSEELTVIDLGLAPSEDVFREDGNLKS